MIQVQYLVECRQLSKGMGNIIKFLKACVSRISPETSEADAKSILLAKVQSFIDERIEFAAESIADFVTSIINDGDVILTFGSSPLVRKVLLRAAKTKQFRLTVIDTRPLHEGLQTLSALSSAVHCIYSPLSGAAVAMADVSKVILGASCLLSNGTMLAAAGSAMVAALAKAKQIPVIVAAESYKFSDKVQLDSIVFNELGHPSEIISGNVQSDTTTGKAATPSEARYRGSAADQQTEATIDGNEHIALPVQWNASATGSSKLPFEVVNLRYDLTPLANISVVATETGLIPPSSVPVLIRELQSDQSHNK
jgi:translation initiation factor eIF-2B subunit delta